MSTQTPSDKPRPEGTPPAHVSWQGLTRWRRAVAYSTPFAILGVAAWAYSAVTDRHASEFAPLAILVAIFLGAGLVGLGVLSRYITRAINREPRRAIAMAVASDVVILVFALQLVIVASFGELSLNLVENSPLWAGLLYTLGSGGELAYLLRTRWDSRAAWPVFCLFAAGLVWIAVVVPTTRADRRRQDVRPLLTHMNSHWVRIPVDAHLFMAPVACGPYPHSHVIHIDAGQTSVDVEVDHVGEGRWSFRAGERPHAIAFSVALYPRSWEVRSVADAREVLRQCGVVDAALSQGEAFQDEYSRLSGYEFRSRLGQGRYRVRSGNVTFCLDRPLKIP